MKKIELAKQTLRVLTADEAGQVAGGLRAIDPSRIPCISQYHACVNGVRSADDQKNKFEPVRIL